MSLADILRKKPVIYEVVPPRISQQNRAEESKLKGLEGVLADKRISAVNIPELIAREENEGNINYRSLNVAPEEYAKSLSHTGKEIIVNIISPRMQKDDFMHRVDTAFAGYGIKNLIVVGKERGTDKMPGYNVLEAMSSISSAYNGNGPLLGGICIFDRATSANRDYTTSKGRMREYERIAQKARNGCRFVTSQIVYDAGPVKNFLSEYNDYCEKTGDEPITVFISMAPISSENMLCLMRDRLDVHIPVKTQKRLLASEDIGAESIDTSKMILRDIMDYHKQEGIRVPLGLQIEQIGINNAYLAKQLLDSTYGIFKGRSK